MRGKILIVEDVPEMAELIKDNLEFEGFEAVVASSGEEGMQLAEGRGFDLVVLDINLPGMDGFEFLEKLRKRDTVPVIIVSARDGEGDLVAALGIGADEYMAKPFSPRVLVARARALVRRNRDYAGPDSREVRTFGTCELDLNAGTLMKDGERVPLSAKEFALLSCLVKAEGKPLRTEEIFDAVWDRTYGDVTAVGVYIQRLRRKIEADPAAPVHIITERGSGYRFQESPA